MICGRYFFTSRTFRFTPPMRKRDGYCTMPTYWKLFHVWVAWVRLQSDVDFYPLVLAQPTRSNQCHKHSAKAVQKRVKKPKKVFKNAFLCLKMGLPKVHQIGAAPAANSLAGDDPRSNSMKSPKSPFNQSTPSTLTHPTFVGHFH